MGDKRAGGIVAAVTLTIAAAFLAIAFLIIYTSVETATQYSERSLDLYSSELLSELETVSRNQYELVDASQIDAELTEAFEREEAGAPAVEVAASVAPLLARSTVHGAKGSAFALSAASHTLYLANGSFHEVDDEEWGRSWYLFTDPGRDGGSTLRISGVTNAYYGEGVLAAGRCIRTADAGSSRGALGALIPASNLSDVVQGLWDEEPPQTVLFDAAGRVLLSTVSSVPSGSSMYESFPDFSEAIGTVAGGDEERVLVWKGLEGILPQGQELCEVRRSKALGCNLYAATSAETIFAGMRSRATTLILALIVVMVLLLLLVMFIVRWYRTRLMKAATTDELTGLANRKWFSSSFRTMAEEGMGEAHLALIDVDKFKSINDTYGHAMGDKALAAVAEEVARMSGKNGAAGRWGGDEFIAVLRGPASQAAERAQQMIGAVAAREFEGGMRVSVSVGLAAIGEGDTLERAVEHADDALYVTKEGGRGFLTVYEEGVTPHMLDEQGSVLSSAAAPQAVEKQAEVASEHAKEPGEHVAAAAARSMVDLVIRSLLEAVNKMVPFVAGGGILIAIAFLIDGASVDMNSLTAEARANFGSITPLAAGLRDVGSAAFNFMLPIFAAFFARALAGDEAFMAGFAGGYLSSQGSAGFAGAIAAAAVAAIVVNLMRGLFRETSVRVQRVAPVLLYPVFSLLIMYLLMNFVIDPVASAFDGLLTSMLKSLSSAGRTVLAGACGGMMATDMGGPINKAAYHFGTASIASGSPDIMAAVMLGGMVPPCGIALCMLLFRSKFSEPERDQAWATFFMGLSFITEGALPFVLTDPARVIPSCMLGSCVAGVLSETFGCTLMAPHGGVFVFPVVERPVQYACALAVGSLVCALVLGLLKRPVSDGGTVRS